MPLNQLASLLNTRKEEGVREMDPVEGRFMSLRSTKRKITRREGSKCREELRPDVIWFRRSVLANVCESFLSAYPLAACVYQEERRNSEEG
ncbi:unnamed protein product [Lasius platythorax]|uniref:Uncharacterized protein n=1 Tax=Lasius platythorax TaxID=488582 RepID=A0AAV2N3M3_9HYME